MSMTSEWWPPRARRQGLDRSRSIKSGDRASRPPSAIRRAAASYRRGAVRSARGPGRAGACRASRPPGRCTRSAIPSAMLVRRLGRRPGLVGRRRRCWRGPRPRGRPPCRTHRAPKPRVVSAGVPKRMPLVYQAPLGSPGHRVAVGDHAGVEQRRLGLAAGDAVRRHVEQHDVVVRAAGDQASRRGRGSPRPATSRCRRCSARRSGTTAAAPRPARRPWRPSRATAGRRAPSGSRGRRHRRTPPGPAPAHRADRAATCAWSSW